MNKMDLVRQLRNIKSADNLDKVAEHMEMKLSGDDRFILREAADHRRAEIAMNRFFDRVPKEAWKYVR